MDLQTDPLRVPGADGSLSSSLGATIMSGFTPLVIECLSFLAVFAVANAVTQAASPGHNRP